MISVYLRRTAVAIAATAVIASTPAASGGDFTPVFQYELALGKQPTGTFYLAYQATETSQAAAIETDAPGSLRIPVYSGNPGEPTMFSAFSKSMRAAGSGTATFGEVLGVVAGITLIGLSTHAYVKEVEKAYEPDLSHIDYPEFDPELLQSAPPSRGIAHGRQ
jgi:hypothetical protein